MYDVVVTLTDNAKITKDGAVVGGNKIKIGLPITLEGADYKFTGSVFRYFGLILYYIFYYLYFRIIDLVLENCLF